MDTVSFNFSCYSQAAALAGIAADLQLEVFSLRKAEPALEGLLRQLADTLGKHVARPTLDACVHALLHATVDGSDATKVPLDESHTSWHFDVMYPDTYQSCVHATVNCSDATTKVPLLRQSGGFAATAGTHLDSSAAFHVVTAGCLRSFSWSLCCTTYQCNGNAYSSSSSDS